MSEIKIWLCEVCKVQEEIEIDSAAGAYEVILLIKDAHTKKSPKCVNPLSGLRIVTL